MDTRINARHKVVDPNRFEPTNLNFGRGEVFAVSSPKTNLDSMQKRSLEQEDGLSEDGLGLSSSVHLTIIPPQKFKENKKFNPAGSLLRHGIVT